MHVLYAFSLYYNYIIIKSMIYYNIAICACKCKVKILYTSKAEAEEAGREAEAASLLPALPSVLPISCYREYDRFTIRTYVRIQQSLLALTPLQIFLKGDRFCKRKSKKGIAEKDQTIFQRSQIINFPVFISER